MNKQAKNDEQNEQQDKQQDDVVQGQSDDVQKVEEELEQLKQQVDGLQNQLKRAVADYQNLEKRVAEGRSELTSFVATELVKKLVPVLDHMQKALDGASEDEKKSGWYKGVQMATQQFKNVLRDEGLEEISADGQFDPALHEAIDMREGKDGEILEVVETGYMLNGKILKAAKVVVGKKG